MSVPTQNTLNDRVNELESVVYGSQVIGGSPAFGVRTTAVVNLSGSTDAITLLASDNNFYVTTAGVDAMTLATPIAGAMANGGDDGRRVRVTDVGGHAHTITTAANKIVPSHDTATFSGTAGAFIDLEAFNGLWYVKASSGQTLSEV